MAKSITKNYIYNLSYQLLTLITPFITIPYLSRVLGPDGIGEYSFTFSVVTYFVLVANLGVSNYAQREIAYHQDDRLTQSRIFYEVNVLRLFLVSVNLIVYYFMISSWQVSHTIYWLQALNIAAVLFDISWLFQGLEEFGKIVLRNFIVRIANVALIFILVHQSSDLLIYTALMGGMNILSGVLIWLYLPKYLERVSIREWRPFRNFLIILQLFLPQIAIQVYVVLDKTMLGLLSGSFAENGYYEQADKMVKLLLTIVTSLGTVMMPRISFAHAHGLKEDVMNYMMKSYRFTWFLSISMCLGLISTAPNFVPWFYGPGYEKVIVVLQAISGIVIAIGISNVTGIQYLVPTNRQNQLTLSVIVGAAFNFGINFYLIPKYHSVGVAIVTLLTEWLVTMVQLYMVRRDFGFKTILSQSTHYWLAGMIMFMITITIEQMFSPTIIHTGVIAIIGGAVYIGILLGMRDSVLMEGISAAREKLGI